MKAYRIVDWWKYEITSKGRLATARTPMKDIRKTPLVFVRFPIHGHTSSAAYLRMVKRAGDNAAACDGVYKALVGLAGSQFKEFRGWILDDRQKPLDPEQVAELLFLPKEQVQQIYAILMDEDVKWLELAEFPKARCRSKKAGVSMEKNGVGLENNGVALNEAETEAGISNRFEANRNETRGVPGEENFQPQPAALASVPVPVPDSVPASDSEVPVSASASDADTDSVSKPGPRAGAEGTGAFSQRQRLFELHRQCQKAALELSQIIPPRNTSDTTTIDDIYVQLQQRIVAGSPYDLFDMSLNTARQCWRGKNPIAMFVAAMKKPPFLYVPKKLSVVPGKFSRDKNTERR